MFAINKINFFKTQIFKFSSGIIAKMSPKIDEEIWFPKTIEDVIKMEKKTLKGGIELKSDHPGFKDKDYLRRREEISNISNAYQLGDKIPFVKYTKEENECWELLYNTLGDLHEKHACKEFNHNRKLLQINNVFNSKEIPQMENINKYLNHTNNWFYKPVDGILTERQFLNALAFRVFYSTQFIRHTSLPFFSAEPDLIHEYLGHAPLFADKDICQLSQDIGIASLGASDEIIRQLSAIYWYTIEFGFCMENGVVKMFGAGVLACVDDIQRIALEKSNKPQIRDFNINEMININYSLVDLQEIYFILPSFQSFKTEFYSYLKTIKKAKV